MGRKCKEDWEWMKWSDYESYRDIMADIRLFIKNGLWKPTEMKYSKMDVGHWVLFVRTDRG